MMLFSPSSFTEMTAMPVGASLSQSTLSTFTPAARRLSRTMSPSPSVPTALRKVQSPPSLPQAQA